jgi:hypothetical protein
MSTNPQLEACIDELEEIASNCTPEEALQIIAGIQGILNANAIPPIISLVPPARGDESDMDEWTGRVVYALQGDDEVEENSIGFYCGPECKGEKDEDGDGGGLRLSDCSHAGTMHILEQMFKDFPEKWIDASENQHILYIPRGNKIEIAKAEIVHRLEKAGAVKMKDPFS